MTDTIFALSSGRPPAAVSIIRVSGPHAHRAGELLAGSLPAPRHAGLRELRDPVSGDLLDEALVLRFDGSSSSTGEDVVELHCHGGRAVVDAVLGAIGGIDTLRPAQPGEFTRRAFENGRIDLIEAEGLADLLEAETESQRRAALMLAEGALTRQIAAWQQRLLDLSARAEAAIDYVEEDSIDTDDRLSCDCGALASELAEWLARPRAEPLKDGIRVVLGGPPNAGKSSLLNAIAGEERAIVTEVPGTTRDHIDVLVSVSGIPLRLTDTAGLRNAPERVEQLGVERARRVMDTADILVWLGEPEAAPAHARIIKVHSRCDLPGRGPAPAGSIAVSSTTGEGVAQLTEEILSAALALLPPEGQLALNRRQSDCLNAVCLALRSAAAERDIVVIAELLRVAQASFHRLTGRAGTEEMLDALFGRFCLGK